MEGHKILFVGATGYIGGSILNAVLASPTASLKASSLAAVVRRQDQADALSAAATRVEPLLFSGLDDVACLRRTAADFDVVVYAADASNAAAAQALLQGLGDRGRTGKYVHYFHSTGTSSFADMPVSEAFREPTPRVFSDKGEDLYGYLRQREAQQSYAQRAADLAVIDEGLAQEVPTHIISAPLAYGRGTGLFHKTSIQIPVLTGAAVAAGGARYIADGEGVWDHVHVEDLAALWALMLGKVLGGEILPAWKDGIYFADAGRHTWREAADRIGAAGVQLGKLKNGDSQSITLEDAAQQWLGGSKLVAELALASRVATSGDKARGLGWKPQKTDEDWQKTFLDEYKAAVEAHPGVGVFVV